MEVSPPGMWLSCPAPSSGPADQPIFVQKLPVEAIDSVKRESYSPHIAGSEACWGLASGAYWLELETIAMAQVAKKLWASLCVEVYSPAFWLTLAVKATLVILLMIGAFSGLQQFEGKAFLWRLITYPVAAFVVPIAWSVTGRRDSYPYTVDILLTLPFLIDTVGNALDLYDTISWWDDANHLVNWTLLSGAIGALAWRKQVRAWSTLAYVVGFGATTAILWEIAEYIAFIRDSPELETAYRDTLGDLTLGLTGSFLAGVGATLPRRKWS